MSGVLLPAAIHETARRCPDSPVVLCEDRTRDYAWLRRRALAVSRVLREWGVGPEDRVVISGARHEDTVAAMLGCWFAGAAYVPLDPALPPARASEVLADCGAPAALTDVAGAALLSAAGFRGRRITFSDIDDAAQTGASLVPVPVPVAAGHAAHVLYTSGSTGTPKGVITTFGNITAFVEAVRAWAPGVGPAMRACGVASFGFDATTYDLFVPWHVGGAVVLTTDRERADPALLTHALVRGGADFGFLTPTLLSGLRPEDLPDLRTIVCGGEVVPAAVAAQWSSDRSRAFFDAYGPTESTVSQTAIRLEAPRSDPLPIGHALPGQRLHVLGADGAEVTGTEIGELGIGGAGVARGYLGLPGRTAAAFLPEPGHPGHRMYCTGDLVRRDPVDGLVYVGRRDDQVKVRGQRIEPGEAEACLRRVPGLSEVAVVPVDRSGGTELAAVVSPAELMPERVRDFAREHLPAVAVPTVVLPVHRLPVAGSGKVDRVAARTLAQAHADELASAPVAGDSGADPRPDVVLDLWRRVLDVPVQEGDDFLALGGHSVSAVRLVNLVRSELGRELSVESVLAEPSTAGFRTLLTDAPASTEWSFDERQDAVLTPSQERLWFVDQLDPEGTAYNVAFAVEIRGDLDEARLADALRELAARHEVLRWRIVGPDGAPQPVVDAPVPELRLEEVEPARLDERIAAAGGRRFDLAVGPLWSSTVLRCSDQRAVLVLAFHHAAVDGWSQQPLFRDLGLLYRGEPVPSSAGFGAYAQWRSVRDRQRRAADTDWWREHLEQVPTVLDLPRDRARPPVATSAGHLQSLPMNDATQAAVRSAVVRLAATPAVIVLAALGEVLRRLVGSRDLMLGGIVSDRPRAEFLDSVGFFVDIVPYRLACPAEATFAEAVARVQEEINAAAGHPCAALQDIVRAVRPVRDPSVAPLVQVAYNVYNFPTPQLDLGAAVTCRELPLPAPGSPFDLTVYLAERAGRYELDLVHNLDLFEPGRIHAVGRELLHLVARAAENPSVPMSAWSTDLPLEGFTGVDAPVSQAHRRLPSAAARSVHEEEIGTLWAQVLGRTSPVTTNFFDAGGDSLAVARLARLVGEHLGREVPVVDAFRYPTVRHLSAHLDEQGGGVDDAAERARAIAAARRSRQRRRSRT